MTLSIDCGGLSIKASVLDEDGTMHAPAVAVLRHIHLHRWI